MCAPTDCVLLQALVEKDLVVSSVLPDNLQFLVEPLCSSADSPQVSVWEVIVLHQCYIIVVYTFSPLHCSLDMLSIILLCGDSFVSIFSHTGC